MKITTTIFAFVILSAGVLMTQDFSFAQETCGAHKLIVIVNERRPTKVVHAGAGGANADDLTVCIGDNIEWKVVGPDKAFYVDFLGGAPFDGDAKKNSNANGKILVTVGGPAEPGMSYKYDIGIVDGGVWDPRIIIAE